MKTNTGLTSAIPVALVVLLFVSGGIVAVAQVYPVVDTGQILCYDSLVEISCPAEGEAFYGQDSQYHGNQPSYTISGNGLTVYDNITGLTWQQSPDTDGDSVIEYEDKMSFWDAQSRPAVLNAMSYGGFSDWRLPSIKEMYSLIDFSGVDPSGYEGGTAGLVPFINTDFFGFEYGDESAGERIIDSQYWSSNEYVSTTMGGDHTVFGVNLADGRIKGYGTTLFGNDKLSFVQCVRGNTSYGVNDYTDNGDGTVTDNATGLMWMQDDSGSGMFWEDALGYAEALDNAGHDDWRLPNAKELQIILDYTRAPNAADPGSRGPAIDPLFSCTAITDEGGGANYPFYWTGTTHANWTTTPGNSAAYICFGEALGWMQQPFPPFEWELMDVHGAGSQRSDPKTGDLGDWPHGHGPQGDVIRIYNFVRCVRDTGTAVETVGCSYTIEPAAGTLPFTTNHQVSLTNLAQNESRRVAATIDVQLAAGSTYKNWRAGWTNLGPAEVYSASWNQQLPALGSLVGENIFLLSAADVTPAPYNQPPYSPSGDTDSAPRTVTCAAP